MGFNCLLSNIPYGEQWRRGRKFLHAHLHAGAAPTYQPVQLSSARRLVKDLLHAKHSKDVLPRMVRANFGATIVKMTYGLDVENSEDDCIIIPEKVLDAMAEASAPGRFFVDAIPICECVTRVHPFRS
jgi:cytochrome P450